MEEKALIRQVEEEIDTSFAACKLKDIGYAQAVWTLLSVNEDYYLKSLTQLSDSELDIFADLHLNALSYPLRVWHRDAKVDSVGIRHELIDEHYKLAWEWLEAALEYYNFHSIFPLWYRDRIRVRIEKKSLVIDLSNLKKEYEAYNRLVRKEGQENPPISLDHSVIDAVLRRTTIGPDWFRINFNPALVSELVSFVSPTFSPRYRLPEEWQFQDFTLKEYKQIFITIQALLYAWCNARVILADRGMIGLGYTSAIWIPSKEELLARLKRYTDVNAATIQKVLDILVFGSNGIRTPDIATQPLIDLQNGFYALSPFVWLNTDAERNLCVLINQIPTQKEIYSKLKNEKESALKSEIIDSLSTLDIDIRGGTVEGTDLDIALIDRNSKVCLCLELKWFIEPAEIREIEERSIELKTGIIQAKKIRALFERNDERLVKEILNITPDYSFSVAIASKNWIGHEHAQDEQGQVPIIKVWHLLNKIRETSLPETVSWLQERRYLPQEGSDFEIMPIEISCEGWKANWYGLKPLVPFSTV